MAWYWFQFSTNFRCWSLILTDFFLHEKLCFKSSLSYLQKLSKKKKKKLLFLFFLRVDSKNVKYRLLIYFYFLFLLNLCCISLFIRVGWIWFRTLTLSPSLGKSRSTHLVVTCCDSPRHAQFFEIEDGKMVLWCLIMGLSFPSEWPRWSQ